VSLNNLWAKAKHTSTFGSSLALTVIINLILSGLGILSGVLAARLLGPTERGALAAIQTWPTLFATLAMIGVPDALVYFSAREPKRAGQWLITAMVTALMGCIPFGVIGYLFLPWLLRAQSDSVIAGSREYLILLPLFAVVGMLTHPLRGRNDIIGWNILRLMPSMAWCFIVVVAFLQNISNPNLLSQYNLIAYFLLIIPFGYIVSQRIPGPFRFSKSMVRPLLHYGFPSFLSVVPATLNLRLDQMLMTGILDSKILGLYTVCVAWSGAAAPLLNAFIGLILPRIAGELDIRQQKKYLSQSTRLGVLISLVLSALVAVITPLMIPLLFGKEYVLAIPAGIILSIAGGIVAINQLLATGAMSLGHPKIVFIAEVIGLLITLALLALLLKPYQLMGAAITSILSYTITFGVFIYFIIKITKLSVTEMLFPQKADFDLIIIRAKNGMQSLFLSKKEREGS
jgi:O-antigen/teichoic acid export membrane protein